MTRDAAITRSRILAAAVKEFAGVGFSGARIDRIAEAAGANKRMIYVYFGDKEGLFNATLNKVLGELVESVPITEHDLPAYAGALFDHLVEHSEAMRLTMWRQLERPSSGPELAPLYAEKVASMQHAGGRSGTVAGMPAMDMLVLVQGLAAAWFISPVEQLTADGTDNTSPQRIAAHRAALVQAAQRITAAPTS